MLEGEDADQIEELAQEICETIRARIGEAGP
jgi:hypothetical protein